MLPSGNFKKTEVRKKMGAICVEIGCIVKQAYMPGISWIIPARILAPWLLEDRGKITLLAYELACRITG